MLSRTLRARSALRLATPSFRATYSSQKKAEVPANDPVARKEVQTVSETNATATSSEGAFDKVLQESVEQGEKLRKQQAPNRQGIWSRSQQPREIAMSGPRFEQSIMEDQPRPYAAIDLIHQQPVRWTHERIVSCDGGGGPLGHPRIFINTDKPQICWCTYCGLPFAHEHHRAHLESLPADQLSYPLGPKGNAAEVNEAQKVTNEPLAQR
ncbi:NADH-ubiquinone oxidoreductase [Macroventuria anomochaeta]|uniref:NADH-ubiquinone oxidoreductase n=1 Tax=Macroventuria anomochaeta TaxID=301207 RepID=A0ACB6S504_9PLEO|nr:NADH-ubiquinone oxidoreductase [Macroventuria anomochaeta]KAF2629231.1 NADH-ubiquinone oxidoreductase [Macroventuria anomochaeta]